MHLRVAPRAEISLSLSDDAWHPIESDQHGEVWCLDAQFTNGYCFTSSIMIFGNIAKEATVQVRFVISVPHNDIILVFQSYSMEHFHGGAVHVRLGMKLDEEGIFVGATGNYFQRNCTLLRSLVEISGAISGGAVPAKIEGTGIFECTKSGSV